MTDENVRVTQQFTGFGYLASGYLLTNEGGTDFTDSRQMHNVNA
jgi:hypothetical protein